MSLVKKCSCCGYKFKKGDGNICPECFTSREGTLSCNDLSLDLHTHKQGFASTDEGMTEIEKQLEQERLQSAQQKASMSATSSSVGSMATGNRSTNFGSSVSKNSSTSFGGTASGSGSNTVTTQNGRTTTTTYTSNNGSTTTTYSTTYSTGGVRPMHTYNTNNSNNNTARNSAKLIKIIVIVFVVMFLVSFIIPLVAGIVSFNSVKDEVDSYYNNEIGTISVEIPDITIPDIPEIEIPEVPSVDVNGFYYDEYALLNPGTEIKTDDYTIKVGTPYMTDKLPAEYDEEYYLYTEWDNPEECLTIGASFTVTNNSGETLRVCDFVAYIDAMFIEIDSDSSQEYVSEEYFSEPLTTPAFSNDVIENGETYTFDLHYAVPKADVYSVVIVLDANGVEDYVYYIDYYADEIE